MSEAHDDRLRHEHRQHEHRQHDRRAHEQSQREERTEGGDPVCWLDRVCDECGAMREDVRAADCARCGAAFPDAGGAAGGTRQRPAG